MFDADKGRTAVDKKIDGLTDRLAAEFEDRMNSLSMTQQEQLVEQLLAVMSDNGLAASFAAGTYAQNSAGQPAAQLGAGAAPTPNDLQQSLNVILAAPGVTDGQKAAMTRIFFGGPDHIAVEDDGTPKELISTRNQRDTEKRSRETAERSLAEERDPNKAGSLAKQLAAAQATPATPADMIPRADVKSVLEDIRQHAVDLQGPLNSTVRGKKELLDGITGAIATVS
ncbi:MAG: hypothetical protein JWM00_239 [Candidatus Saccharibacteria bacterium]|nr:hypothetical protein [Candidatus Saccharibacteria bacterium]